MFDPAGEWALLSRCWRTRLSNGPNRRMDLIDAVFYGVADQIGSAGELQFS